MESLGYLCWWHLTGVQLPPDVLRQRLVLAGFLLPSSRTISGSRLIVQAIERIPGVIGVRREGGLVFAPPAAYADLVRLRALFAGLPAAGDAPARLHLVAVAGTPENRAALVEAVAAGLMQDLTALGRDLDHLQAKGRATRAGTRDERRACLRALRDRAELHATLLTAAHQAQIDVAVAALERRLDGE